MDHNKDLIERRIVDIDPLNRDEEYLLMGSYKTTCHKLKLFTTDEIFRSPGKYVLIGADDIVDCDNIKRLEVYTKVEWLIDWCENKIKRRFGWFLLRDIAPLILRELKNGNVHFYTFDLIREYELNKIKELHNNTTNKERRDELIKEDIGLEHTGGGNLQESVLIKNSIELRKKIFGDLLQEGRVVMRHFNGQQTACIEEIDYYGIGTYVGPLAGSGGISFMYDDREIYYQRTWIS